MIATDLAKDVSSFVSFALAMKPSVTLYPHRPGDAHPDAAVEFTFDNQSTLSQAHLSSIESLIRKYEPIKDYLRSYLPQDGETLSPPTVTFQPNVEYRMVKISSRQLTVAKEVAQQVERTHSFHANGDNVAATAAYNDLQAYLKQKRDELIGDFRSVSQITGATGLPAVGNIRKVAEIDGTEVIFIIIEIFVL